MYNEIIQHINYYVQQSEICKYINGEIFAMNAQLKQLGKRETS